MKVIKLTKEEQEQVLEETRIGKSPERISIELCLDYDDVVTFLDSLEPKNRYARLSEVIDDLEDVCRRTKMELDQGADNAMLVQAYQRVANEYRVALAELDSLQTPEERVGELMERAFNPFVKALLKVCVEETNKLQQELVKYAVPERDAKNVSTELFKRLADSLKGSMSPSADALRAYFGAKKQEEAAQGVPGRTLQ
jgi:hypothetical protein